MPTYGGEVNLPVSVNAYQNVSKQSISFTISGVTYSVLPGSQFNLNTTDASSSTTITNYLASGTIEQLTLHGNEYTAPTTIVVPVTNVPSAYNDSVASSITGNFNGITIDSVTGHWMLSDGNRLIYPNSVVRSHPAAGIASTVSIEATIQRQGLSGSFGFSVYTDAASTDHTFNNGYLVLITELGVPQIFSVVAGLQTNVTGVINANAYIDINEHTYAVGLTDLATGSININLYQDGILLTNASSLTNSFYTNGRFGFATAQGCSSLLVTPASVKYTVGLQAHESTSLATQHVITAVAGKGVLNISPPGGVVNALPYNNNSPEVLSALNSMGQTLASDLPPLSRDATNYIQLPATSGAIGFTPHYLAAGGNTSNLLTQTFKIICNNTNLANPNIAGKISFRIIILNDQAYSNPTTNCISVDFVIASNNTINLTALRWVSSNSSSIGTTTFSSPLFTDGGVHNVTTTYYGLSSYGYLAVYVDGTLITRITDSSGILGEGYCGIINTSLNSTSYSLLYTFDTSQETFEGANSTVQTGTTRAIAGINISGRPIFSDNTTIDSLRPAQVGADVTSSNTANDVLYGTGKAVLQFGADVTSANTSLNTTNVGSTTAILAAQGAARANAGINSSNRPIFSDGTTIDSLRPAVIGADVTSANTALNTTNVGSTTAVLAAQGASRANATIDSGNVVVTSSIDFSRLYTNKNLTNIPDDLNYRKVSTSSFYSGNNQFTRTAMSPEVQNTVTSTADINGSYLNNSLVSAKNMVGGISSDTGAIMNGSTVVLTRHDPTVVLNSTGSQLNLIADSDIKTTGIYGYWLGTTSTAFYVGTTNYYGFISFNCGQGSNTQPALSSAIAVLNNPIGSVILQVNTVYTFSLLLSGLISGPGISMAVLIYSGSSVIATINLNSSFINQRQSITFTTPSSGTFNTTGAGIVFGINCPANTIATAQFGQLQIELGPIATAYKVNNASHNFGYAKGAVHSDYLNTVQPGGGINYSSSLHVGNIQYTNDSIPVRSTLASSAFTDGSYIYSSQITGRHLVGGSSVDYGALMNGSTLLLTRHDTTVQSSSVKANIAIDSGNIITVGSIDFSRSYTGKNLDNINDGPSAYQRMPISNMDSNRKALIDFSQTGHIGKVLDNIGDTVSYSKTAASTQIGNTPSRGQSGTNMLPNGSFASNHCNAATAVTVAGNPVADGWYLGAAAGITGPISGREVNTYTSGSQTPSDLLMRITGTIPANTTIGQRVFAAPIPLNLYDSYTVSAAISVSFGDAIPAGIDLFWRIGYFLYDANMNLIQEYYTNTSQNTSQFFTTTTVPTIAIPQNIGTQIPAFIIVQVASFAINTTSNPINLTSIYDGRFSTVSCVHLVNYDSGVLEGVVYRRTGASAFQTTGNTQFNHAAMSPSVQAAIDTTSGFIGTIRPTAVASQSTFLNAQGSALPIGTPTLIFRGNTDSNNNPSINVKTSANPTVYYPNGFTATVGYYNETFDSTEPAAPYLVTLMFNTPYYFVFSYNSTTNTITYVSGPSSYIASSAIIASIYADGNVPISGAASVQTPTAAGAAPTSGMGGGGFGGRQVSNSG